MALLSKLVITPALLRLISEIDEFKGRWETLGDLAPERLSGFRRITTIESVGSSTRIEGVKLSDEEIDRLLSGLSPRSFRSRDEQEVAGYAELMEMIFESAAHMPLTENTLRQLHGVLLKYSHKDERHRGEYKTLPNHVEAFDAEGSSLGVVFETASPFDTPRLMEALIGWTQQAFEEKKHHPLLVLAVFVVRFLAIHPFQDGNGRLSRALTTLILLKRGYHYVQYSSLERIIEDSKEGYYLSLRHAQATLDQDESKLGDWVHFFIRALRRQQELLETKLQQERLMSPLPPLSEQLLALAAAHGRLTVREATAILKANRNTIKSHLSRLVRNGHLKRRGQGRGTWYQKP